MKRGRPKLANDEKGNYSPFLVGEEVLRTLQANSTNTLPEDETTQRQKLHTLKQEPEACEYYWKLVFAYSFFVYKNTQLTDAIFLRSDEAALDHIKKMNLKQFAQLVGIEYHNFKNMYSGRGNAKNLLQYQAFLFENGVNFIELQYTERVIQKAYQYYECLAQENHSRSELKKLFF